MNESQYLDSIYNILSAIVFGLLSVTTAIVLGTFFIACSINALIKKDNERTD